MDEKTEMSSENGWSIPRSGEMQLNIFKAVRDDVLMKVLTDLQLGPAHHQISVDGESPNRPIQIDWDSHLSPTISWNETIGAFGPGLVIKRKTDSPVLNATSFVGMVQVGGNLLSSLELETSTNPAIKRRWSKSRKKYVVVTMCNYFLSPWTLSFVGRIPNGNLDWYQVNEAKWTLAIAKVIGNFGRTT